MGWWLFWRTVCRRLAGERGVIPEQTAQLSCILDGNCRELEEGSKASQLNKKNLNYIKAKRLGWAETYCLRAISA
jgi:hypothetical protein